MAEHCAPQAERARSRGRRLASSSRPDSVRLLLLGVFVLGVWAPAVRAQSNRVFASARSGNDLNSCNSITTPCQTLQGAVNQVAAGGTVIVLDTGGYGPVTIGKALTIDAPPGIVAFIHPPSGNAVTVLAGASDVVVLRGLSLNVGPAQGIAVSSVGSLYVENCTVVGFSSVGLLFGSAGQLFVKDSTFSANGGEGILVSPPSGTATAAIDRCRLEGNGGPFQTGAVVAGTNSMVTVRDSVASGNFRGFQAGSGTGQTLQLNVESCVSTANIVGLFAANGAGTVLRASNTVVTNNTLYGIEAQGSGSVLSRSNNTVEGNAAAQTFSGTYAAK